MLTFYPALQVPMAYLFFVLAGVLIASHRKHGSYSWKDPLIIGCFFLLFCAGMAYVLTKSWDTVQTVLNTAYPGHRADCGGGAAALLAQYPMDALTPLRSFSDSLRIDAYASVYDFFPLGMLLALWVLVRERTRDTVLVALLAVSAFVGWYCFIGFPEPLAKLTLMSLSTGGLYSKAFIVFGLVNLLLLFRSLSLLQAQPSRRAATALAAVLALALTAACAFTHTWFFSIPVFAACLLALAGGFFVLLRRSSGMMCAYLTALALFMGVMVNPVQVGASPLLDNQTRQAVAAVNAENPASRWVVTGKDSSAFADLAATSGAAVINTCNVYPNLELWQKFDPSGTFDNLYNRYAHISIEITHEDSHFGDAGFDSFSLYLNPNDTDLLDVDYLLTTQDLAGFSTDEVLFERIAEVGDHAIYQVVQR